MKELYIPSSDGKNQLHVVIWEPNITVIGIVQISHGMIEYIKRYDEFALYIFLHGEWIPYFIGRAVIHTEFK